LTRPLRSDDLRPTRRLAERCFFNGFQRRRLGLLLLSSLVAIASYPLYGLAQQNADAGQTRVREQRNGARDFDFSIGNWRTHIKRRVHPLTGSTEWAQYDGISIVRAIWNGRASFGETEADGPAGHLEALSLRLYNPHSHQWALSYASVGGTTSTASSLSIPTIGEFDRGRGEFYDTEAYNGRNILVRNRWSDITPNSIRFEQAFSEDGGQTWEVNWIAVDTRMAPTETPAPPVPASSKLVLSQPGNQHDFDFEFGKWRAQIKRLEEPLTNSKNWSEYAGLMTVSKVWSGLANLGELEVDSSATHIEGLSFRLYNANSHQWSIYWINSNDGMLGTPLVGGFKNGRGEFYGRDNFQGTELLVRLVISDIKPASFQFEQALSLDGGKTWKANGIGKETRIADESDTTQ
jgi:hypothetical protein